MSEDQKDINPMTKEIVKEIVNAEAQNKVAKALRWIFKKFGLR